MEMMCFDGKGSLVSTWGQRMAGSEKMPKKNRPRQDINQISLEATRHTQVQYTEFSEVCLHFICLPPGLGLQHLLGLEA